MKINLKNVKLKRCGPRYAGTVLPADTFVWHGYSATQLSGTASRHIL
jgi:hypothetical protein